MPVFPKRVLLPALLTSLLLLTFLVYLPGLAGDFIFDDFPNIVDNESAHLQSLALADLATTWSSGVTTTLNRPLSMMSFGLNHYFTGLNPFYFKLTSLVVHLLTTLGIYVLSRELLRIGAVPRSQDDHRLRLLSLFITACWALHPLFVSSVLYIVQRMTLLATLMEVVALIFYCRFRQLEGTGKGKALAAFVTFGVLILAGVLFKETAILTVLFCLLIEFFLLQFRADSAGQRLFVRLFLSVMIIVPAIAFLVLLALSPESVIGNYAIREFTLWERVLTETRILWVYIGWMLMPDTRDFVFHHDNFPLSHGLTDPLTTLLAIAGILALFAFCIAFRRKTPYLCFGIAFFFAGHILESTIINLELVFEHRNYLPGYGLLLGVIYTLLNFHPSILGARAASIFLAFFLVFLVHGTFQEARKWADSREHLLSMVRENPGSHRINYSLGFYYLNLASLTPNNSVIFDASSIYYKRSIPLDSKAIRSHIGAILADSQNGKAIDKELLADLEYRLRTYSLLDNSREEVSKLTECYYGNFCKLDPAILIRIYTALAENVADDPVVPQAILDQLGSAIIGIYKRPQDGMALLYLARSLRPMLTIIDIKLIQLETEFGNLARARQLVEEARDRPGTPFLEQEIQNLITKLEDAEAQLQDPDSQ